MGGSVRDRGFERFADALPLMLWVAEPSGACSYLNRRWYGFTGATPEQSVGFGWLDVIHPDDRQRWWDAWREATRATAACDVEVRYRSASGAYRWVLVRAVPAPDDAGVLRWFGTSTDVDDQRRIERMLEASQRMAKLGSWELDLGDLEHRDQNPLRWSSEAYRVFGFEPGEVEVTNDLFFSHVHPDDRAAIVAAVDRALATLEPYQIEHRIVRADGAVRAIHEWAVIETDAARRPVRMLGTCQDITERKELEAALRRHAEQLAAADQRKNDFLAMLAHELRNPLGPIRNGVCLLRKRGAEDAQLSRIYDMIDRQAEHMSRLVADLLDVSRITRDKITLELRKLDLARLARDVVNDYRPAFEAAGVAVSSSVGDDPLWIRGDATRLAQALGNLLHNAVKFTPRGGHVAVALDRDNGWARFQVRDDGMGIEPDLLSRVFEPFAQADQALDRRRGGLGLGLALVKGLVKLHGGHVAAESAGLGKGATFRMSIPMTTAPTVSMSTPADDEGVSRLRVLVVEDNEDAAETLELILVSSGHDVKTAHSGKGALAVANDWVPEVVVCDIGLPEMDGYTVCKKMRERPEMRGCRFIALTGYNRPEDIKHAADVGFHEHLTKPVDPAELERVIARAA